LSVANTFLSTPGWRVRGITRNPQSAAAQALTAKGVEIVGGDLNDHKTLAPAFEGANVIFANTDFFQPLLSAISAPETTNGRTARAYGYDVELRHGLNIAEAAATLANLKTLERFVFSSLSDATKCSKGKYTGVHHNDVKAEIERKIHARFPELAQRMSTIHMGHYTTNWQIFPPAAPRKQPDGSFVFERIFSPDWICPFIVADKDTGRFVKALIGLPPGTNLEATSEALTFPQFAQLWGDVLGLRATYKQVSVERHFEGLPNELTAELSQCYAYENEFGQRGGEPKIVSAEKVSLHRASNSTHKIPPNLVSDGNNCADYIGGGVYQKRRLVLSAVTGLQLIMLRYLNQFRTRKECETSLSKSKLCRCLRKLQFEDTT
jgi:hypothetical protein